LLIETDGVMLAHELPSFEQTPPLSVPVPGVAGITMLDSLNVEKLDLGTVVPPTVSDHL
jgi:hypothetical protein